MPSWNSLRYTSESSVSTTTTHGNGVRTWGFVFGEQLHPFIRILLPCCRETKKKEYKWTIHRITTSWGQYGRAGFLRPCIEFEVVTIPGFVQRPPVTHHKNIVPPPLRAYVRSNTSNESIIFRDNRTFCVHSAVESMSLTTNRMHRMLVVSRQAIGMKSF